MAIYQPTNVYPDLVSGTENGTILYDPNTASSTYVTVSWNVNGNSTLVAYKVDIYENNAASTLSYSTGKMTLGTPFSAVDAYGNVQRFTCQILVEKFVTAAKAANGYTGKIKITQWWSANDSVEQQSMSVYRVTGISSISAGRIDNMNYYGGVYKFQGTFTSPNPDNFNTSVVWARWQIFNDASLSNCVQDTGKVWGATSYQWINQQLRPGFVYYVVFSVLTSMGEMLEADPVSVDFDSAGKYLSITGSVTAECKPNIQAIQITAKYSDILQGVSAPNSDFSTYVNSSGELYITPTATATWTIPETASGTEWGFMWIGRPSLTAQIVTVTNGDGKFARLDTYQGTTRITYEGQVIQLGSFSSGETVYLYVTTGTGADASNWYFYMGKYTGGTYSYSRYQLNGFLFNKGATVKFGNSTSTGTSTTSVFRIVYGEQGYLYVAATTGQDGSTLPNPQVVLPYPNDVAKAELGYGVISYFGMDTVRDGAVCRSVNGGPAEYFAEFSGIADGAEIVYFDYGTASGNSYEYFVYNKNDIIIRPTMHSTGMVFPCWWDWALIEAEPDGVWAKYKPVNVFRFNLNAASGSDGNGSAPGVYNNFTRYPIVMRDTTNRHSGTLTGLIGYIGAPGEYTDSTAIRDALRALSTTKNALFLRSRRGDFFKVAIASEITTSVTDNSPKQQITASVPWVEIGPVDGSVVEAGIRFVTV